MHQNIIAQAKLIHIDRTTAPQRAVGCDRCGQGMTLHIDLDRGAADPGQAPLVHEYAPAGS
jgi:hypothetical protein